MAATLERDDTVGVTDRETTLVVTSAAARKIRSLHAKHPEADGLRLLVRGGGCSGLEYDFQMDRLRPRDCVVEHDGAKVLMDPKSLIYLRGSEFDYVRTLMKEEFQVTNPNATSSCGCGASFNI